VTWKPGESGNLKGAPPKSRRFSVILDRAIEQDDAKRLRQGIEKLLDKVSEGEAWALQMLADRLEGKPRQAMEHSGPDGEDIKANLTVRFGNGSG
jgi:Family of unknown function (DUF5681)